MFTFPTTQEWLSQFWGLADPTAGAVPTATPEQTAPSSTGSSDAPVVLIAVALVAAAFIFIKWGAK